MVGDCVAANGAVASDQASSPLSAAHALAISNSPVLPTAPSQPRRSPIVSCYREFIVPRPGDESQEAPAGFSRARGTTELQPILFLLF